MKKILLFCICVFGFMSVSGQKVDSLPPQKPTYVLKTSPFVLVWGAVPLTAEFRLNQEFTDATHQATEIGISYLGKSPVVTVYEKIEEEDERLKIYGFRIQMMHRFYLNRLFPNQSRTYTKMAPQGLYIGPHFSYSIARMTTRYYNRFDVFVQATHFNLNIIMGKQLFLSQRFCIDFFAGLGYKKNKWVEHDEEGNVHVWDNEEEFGALYANPLKISFGVNFGVGW